MLVLFSLFASVCMADGHPNDPIVYNPTPSVGEVLVVPDGSLSLNCNIDSPNGSSMMERCWTNASGVFVWSNWAGPFSNTTINWALDASSYNTTYWWGVSANDSYGDNSNTTFSFRTRGQYPPVVTPIAYPDGSTGTNTLIVWNCSITDREGFSFDWNISCSNGDSVIGTGDVNGTKTCVFIGLAYSTTYMVWVNASEDIGGLSTSCVYTFSTKASVVPVSQQNGFFGVFAKIILELVVLFIALGLVYFIITGWMQKKRHTLKETLDMFIVLFLGLVVLIVVAVLVAVF